PQDRAETQTDTSHPWPPHPQPCTFTLPPHPLTFPSLTPCPAAPHSAPRPWGLLTQLGQPDTPHPSPKPPSAQHGPHGTPPPTAPVLRLWPDRPHAHLTPILPLSFPVQPGPLCPQGHPRDPGIHCEMPWGPRAGLPE
ncbi:unnamed protein product, partial [Rangifer tarandus platyrhynchus]